MKQNAIFNIKRFGSLLRRHLLHNYSALLLSLLVVFGISFLVIAFFQYLGRNDQSNTQEYFIIFIFSYAILGAFYISSAFSSFRNKEKAQAYLMIPGSILEKYLVEIIFYPLSYLLLFPILYVTAYQLSSSFISIIVPEFIAFDLIGEIGKIMVSDVSRFEYGEKIVVGKLHIWILFVSISFSLAMAFFLGAASFKKYAMLKTLLGLAAYIGLCIWIIYWLMGVLGWSTYRILENESYLSPLGAGFGNDQVVINFFSICILCFGLTFSVASFFKLREKEV